jgi:hypothetical protein
MNKQYNHICKPCQLVYSRSWQLKNPDKAKAIQVRYKEKHHEELLLIWRKDHKRRRASEVIWNRAYRQRTKLEVLSHYSGNPPQCADPYHIHEKPFTMIQVLSLDHINGNGSQDRKAIGMRHHESHGMYCSVRKRGYPPGYQVLCLNCQTLKLLANEEWKKPQ